MGDDDDSCSLTMGSNDWYGSKWLNVDLPNRTSISDSEGWSFCYPCFGDIVSRSK